MFCNLIFDDNLYQFFKNTYRISRISEMVYRFNTSHINDIGNYFKIDEGSIDIISFIPNSKIDNESSIDSDKNRISIKIGRFIGKLFKDEVIKAYSVNNSEIESFVNVYKSYFNRDKNYKIVDGSDILKYYREDSYKLLSGYRYGTLWNSCMRQFERNEFMSLYSINGVKMLVNVDTDGFLVSRALLWEKVFDTKGNEYKVMDRIYSIHDYEVDSFKKWADNNGYIYRYEQSSKNATLFIKDGRIVEIELVVKLENWKLDSYPYIDTFQFLDYEKGILSNSERICFDYRLVQSDGTLYKRIREENTNDNFDDIDAMVEDEINGVDDNLYEINDYEVANEYINNIVTETTNNINTGVVNAQDVNINLEGYTVEGSHETNLNLDNYIIEVPNINYRHFQT